MFVRVKTTPNSPRKSVQIVESVRDGNRVRQKILRHVGIAMDDDELVRLKELGQYIKAKLEDEHQASLFPPEQVAQQTLDCQKNAPAKDKTLKVDLKKLREDQRVVTGIHDIYGTLFDELGFGRVIRNPARNVSAVDIFRHIVLARIANLDSKRATAAMLETDFGVNLPLEKVYRMMDKLDETAIDRIRQCALQGTRQLFGDVIDVLFFDCTTLYFESFKEDELKSNGYSKDLKFNQPQVMLALLVTTEGLPVGYEVFPGCTFEGHTLKVAVDQLKANYTVNDIVFVADRGMLNGDNLDFLDGQGMPYIVGGKLKALPAKLKSELLAKQPWLSQGTEEKPRYHEFRYRGRRWVVSYSASRAEKDRKDREKAVMQLTKKLGKSKNPKSLLSNYGYKKYLQVEGDSTLIVNQKKIEQDACWDGLKGMVTSLDAPAAEVFGHYRGLWQVEESFRISKHDLKVRPIYHWTPKRVRAHLAISFVAFSLVRFLAHRVKLQYRKLSPACIRNALVHVQQSILSNRQNGERYAIPSNASPEAEKIYQIMGKTLPQTPFRIAE